MNTAAALLPGMGGGGGAMGVSALLAAHQATPEESGLRIVKQDMTHNIRNWRLGRNPDLVGDWIVCTYVVCVCARGECVGIQTQ